MATLHAESRYIIAVNYNFLMLVQALFRCYYIATDSREENSMFGWFGRKKTVANADGTFETFVGATNGGWGDAPKAVPVDGGNHRDYVARMLKEARQIGKKTVGNKPFTFTLHSIPRVEHPDLIVLPLMMEANSYGLQCVSSVDETVTFIRLE